jgi:hypothetical protein
LFAFTHFVVAVESNAALQGFTGNLQRLTTLYNRFTASLTSSKKVQVALKLLSAL